MAPAGGAPHDLTGNNDAALTLLANTWSWRERLVETFALNSSHHVSTSSEYQLKIGRSLLGIPAAEDSARVILPLTRRRKLPLLGFDVEGPDGASAHLLRRATGAETQAVYLDALLAEEDAAGAYTDAFSFPLLTAISAFTPSVLEEYVRLSGSLETALISYLGRELPFPVDAITVGRWLHTLGRTPAILAAQLGEHPGQMNSAENPLLALPLLDEPPLTAAAVHDLLAAYRAGTAALAQGADGGISAFLSTLATYGGRWEMLVDTTVPVAQPFTIRLREDRPLGLYRPWQDRTEWLRPPWRGRSDLPRRGSVTQEVSFGDCRSAHVQFVVPDHAVELESDVLSVRTLSGDPVPFPSIDGVRATSEAIAVYSSSPERPTIATMTVSLRPSRAVAGSVWFIAALLVFAAAAAARVEGPDLAQPLSLLTVPTTFAVSVVLLREQSALSVRLQWSQRVLLVLLTTILWAVVLVRIL